MESVVCLEMSLKRKGILLSPFLFFVCWAADVMARVEAAVLDSEVNLRREAVQGGVTM